MTDREFFVETLKDELPRFERVFNALPESPKDLRHHPKNKNAAEIVSTMASESSVLPDTLSTGIMDFSKAENPEGVRKSANVFKKYMEETLELAGKASEEDWASDAQMLNGEKVEWETSKGKMVWAMLLDLIHHRGQLSTHIRPQGGKVPSIYGPSGDNAM